MDAPSEIGTRSAGALSGMAPALVAHMLPRRQPLDAYLRSPVDRWTAGKGWLHFCASRPAVAGAVLWDALSASALEELLACADAALEHLPTPHVSFVDVARSRAAEPACYPDAAAYVARNRDRLSARVAAFAVVRPIGMLGAVTEGFFRVMAAPYVVETFADRSDALRWLGSDALDSVVDELEEQAQGDAGGASVLANLHRVLDAELATISLRRAARLLGMSVRSLQRRLHEDRTTFQREIAIARVRAAQRAMIETDATITRIACDVGFASPAAFSVVFRRVVAQSPRAWRDAHGGIRSS